MPAVHRQRPSVFQNDIAKIHTHNEDTQQQDPGPPSGPQPGGGLSAREGRGGGGRCIDSQPDGMCHLYATATENMPRILNRNLQVPRKDNEERRRRQAVTDWGARRSMRGTSQVYRGSITPCHREPLAKPPHQTPGHQARAIRHDLQHSPGRRERAPLAATLAGGITDCICRLSERPSSMFAPCLLGCRGTAR